MSHDDVENIGTNTSAAPHIDEIVAKRYSRRGVITGGTATAALLYFGGSVAGAAPAAAAKGRGPKIDFTQVPPSAADTLTVPPEYNAQVLIPWGTPLASGVQWQQDASNTAADQEKQVGFNHDGIHFFPFTDGNGGESNTRGLLVLNHEYTDASQIYTAAQGSAITPDAAGIEKVRKAEAGHGVTVVEIRKGANGWEHVVDSPYNRRVTVNTPVTFTGPVTLDHPALASNNDPKGTLNNCGNGVTPWGSYLACEENWNGNFGTASATWTPSTVEGRYGFSKTGFNYNWHTADSRWDIAANPKEANRFGWIVEIDPNDPDSTPVKRTALGRFKHEDATVTESKGRIVLYSGDDENLEYVYKFVGSSPWRDLVDRGESPLDHGTLYVARFNTDGSGTWIPLVHGVGELTPAKGWADQADVLLRTRQAGDAVGATPLHRPEWLAVDERTDHVYLTLTNGSNFSKSPQDAANANQAVNANRASNPFGHILRWRETGGDHTAKTFEWDIFILAGDPTKTAVTDGISGDNVFGSPDGIWIDDDRRVWIQTDISNSVQTMGPNYDNIDNNSMLVANPDTKKVKRFLVGPRGCEITGVMTTPDNKTMFVNIQHPGESSTAWGTPTTDNPRVVSNWPDFDPAGRPRSATIVITKKDGGVIGS